MATSNKKTILNLIEFCCVYKARRKEQDLIWDSRYISTGFVYKGRPFLNTCATGIAPTLTDEEAEALGVESVWYVLSTWEEVKPHIIRWLNRTDEIAEIVAWLPASVLDMISDPVKPVHTAFSKEVIETDEYLLLESLISLNAITED